MDQCIIGAFKGEKDPKTMKDDPDQQGDYQVSVWGDPALECYQMTSQFTTLCPNSFSQSRGRFFV